MGGGWLLSEVTGHTAQKCRCDICHQRALLSQRSSVSVSVFFSFPAHTDPPPPKKTRCPGVLQGVSQPQWTCGTAANHGVDQRPAVHCPTPDGDVGLLSSPTLADPVSAILTAECIMTCRDTRSQTRTRPHTHPHIHTHTHTPPHTPPPPPPPPQEGRALSVQ